MLCIGNFEEIMDLSRIHLAVVPIINFFFPGIKLFSFIAEKWLKDDKVEEVKVLAKYLDEDVLRDFVASSDLEVQGTIYILRKHFYSKFSSKQNNFLTFPACF